MNELADRVAPHDVGSIFIYTREAHPGENWRHLTSMVQKHKHACALRDELGVKRPIYLDALDGACHLAWGGLSNICYIVTKTGAPAYKANWTHTPSVSEAIDSLLEQGEKRRAGERLQPFSVERTEYRIHDNEGFQRGLERNGPQAIEDMERMRQTGNLPRI